VKNEEREREVKEREREVKERERETDTSAILKDVYDFVF
jgi:hypothetical protein